MPDRNHQMTGTSPEQPSHYFASKPGLCLTSWHLIYIAVGPHIVLGGRITDCGASNLICCPTYRQVNLLISPRNTTLDVEVQHLRKMEALLAAVE